MNKMEIVDIKSGLPVQIPSLGVLNPTQENEFDKIIRHINLLILHITAYHQAQSLKN